MVFRFINMSYKKLYEGPLRLGSKIYDGTVYDNVCYSTIREEYLNN